MRSFYASVLIVGVALCASRVDAQLCEGAAPFSAGRLQAGVGFASGRGARGVDAALAVGTANSLFGSVGASHTSYDGTGSANSVGFGAAYQIAIGQAARVQLCPHVGYSHEFGPDEIAGSALNASADAAGIGFDLGLLAVQRRNFEVMPSLEIAVDRGREMYRGDYFGTSFNETDWSTYGSIGLSLGFVLRRNITVAPGISFPLGVPGGQAGYALAVAVNFHS